MNVRSHIALTAFGALALLAACGGKEGGPGGGAFPPTTVNLALVERRPIRSTSEYVAQVKSRRSVDVQPQVEGYVRRIAVHPGDHVAKGALLMHIDPAKQLQSVRSSEASRASKVASLRLAREQKTRGERLYSIGVISKEQLDQLTASAAAAEAEVANVDAQVAGEKVQLRYYDVTAPEAGVVGDVPVREGDMVTPSTRLTSLDQNAGLEAYINVPIERASQLQRGLDVELLDGDKVVASGKIDFIAPRVSDATQSVLVKVPVASNTAQLRTSQFTNARIIWSSREAPVVPTSAVLRLGGSPFIFVAESDGKQILAKQKSVELGELSGDVYEVKSGVSAGDRIVTSGIQKLHDGAPVAPEGPTK
jgi:RND family efflux transporter MFP subunit